MAGLVLIDLAVSVFGAPPLRRDIGLPWTVSIAVVLSVLALRRRRPAARGAAEIALYGPGYVEMFAPIAAVRPAAPDSAIFTANAVLSAAAAPVTFAIARLAAIEPIAALGAALVVAFDPVALRMGATEAYFVPIIALSIAAAALSLVAVGEWVAARRWHTAAALGASALLLTQTARVHPSAWGLVGCTLFVVLAAAGWLSRAARLRARGCDDVGAGIAVVTSAGALLDVFNNVRIGSLMRPLPPSTRWPLIAIAGVTVVYAIVAPRGRLALPAASSVAVLLLTRHSYDQSWIWQQRVLGIPSYLPRARPAVAIDVRQPHSVDAALRPTACLYYVRTSLCSSDEGAPVCAAIEKRLVLASVARASFPAISSSPLLAYTSNTVETVLARVMSIDGATVASSR